MSKPLEGAIDTCGTGGDGKGSHNISTLAALILAGAGVTVAKHGNRGLSSKSGSSDVLSELGVRIDVPTETVERAIAEANIGFMMAPRHHGAMRHVAGPRVELGTRTIFNLLGPLSNPASVRRQVTGVFSADWIEPLARVLGRLGCERAWVVHGADGTDELSITGPTKIAEWHNGQIRTFELVPEDIGINRVTLDALKGGDPSFNARAIGDVLAGNHGPLRDAGLYAAAAGLVVSDRADSLKAGIEMAAEAVDSGLAAAALAKLVEITSKTTA